MAIKGVVDGVAGEDGPPAGVVGALRRGPGFFGRARRADARVLRGERAAVKLGHALGCFLGENN